MSYDGKMSILTSYLERAGSIFITQIDSLLYSVNGERCLHVRVDKLYREGWLRTHYMN